MYTYDTVSEAVKGLKQRGFLSDFNLEFDRINCPRLAVCLTPSEFEITEVYRFEGNSDPGDEAVVYAIESRHGQKGILVDGFGISSESVSEDMLHKLKLKR